MKPRGEGPVGLETSAAWALILRVRSRRSCPAGPAPHPGPAQGTGWSGDLATDGAGTWRFRGRPLSAEVQDMLDLYLGPACAGQSRPFAVGHLGQSLDGRIATESGLSRFVTGPENIVHLHRMRALCDAVVVGAETVRRDDPRLTTRLVPGPSPVRVILDPRGRLQDHYQVFRDPSSETLVVHDQACRPLPPRRNGPVMLPVPGRDGQLDLQVLRERLFERGLRCIFVEGGGVTVSRFLAQGALERLQVTVAPMILGAGRHGLTLPPVARLEDALRPRARVYRMGRDVLFDCDLAAPAAPQSRPDAGRGEEVEVSDHQA